MDMAVDMAADMSAEVQAACAAPEVAAAAVRDKLVSTCACARHTLMQCCGTAVLCALCALCALCQRCPPHMGPQ